MNLGTLAYKLGASTLLLTVFATAFTPAVMAQERVLGQTRLAYSENDRDVLNLGACRDDNYRPRRDNRDDRRDDRYENRRDAREDRRDDREDRRDDRYGDRRDDRYGDRRDDRYNSRNENIRALKFRALRGTADIASVTVFYGNGRSERLNIREKIRQGRETRWVNLRGRDRCISRIVVVGDTDNSSRREATLRVFGR